MAAHFSEVKERGVVYAWEGEVAQYRDAAKSALLVLCAARDGQSWHENMLKDFDFAIAAIRAALAQ